MTLVKQLKGCQMPKNKVTRYIVHYHRVNKQTGRPCLETTSVKIKARTMKQAAELAKKANPAMWYYLDKVVEVQ